MPTLIPQPLTPEGFAPFGDVLQVPASGSYRNINDNTCRRYDGLARVDVASGATGISIFRAAARAFPLRLELLERHPLGSQAFMPLGAARFVVIAAADAGGAPDWNAVQGFIAGAGQGINFHRAVWHHPLIAVGDAGDFLVIDRLDAVANENTEECAAPPTHQIDVVLPD